MLITANFGTANTGMSVYYRILNSDKTVFQARTDSGVTEIVAGSGVYGVEESDASIAGRTVVWDIDATAKTASETFSSAGLDASIIRSAVGLASPDLDSQLSDLASQLSSVQADVTALSAIGGDGAVSQDILTTVDGDPADGVEVWITSDEAGANIVAGPLASNALGITTFMLDAGTYFVWKQRSGINFTNPKTLIITEPVA